MSTRALPWLILGACVVPPAPPRTPGPGAAPTHTPAAAPAGAPALTPLDLQLDDPQARQCGIVDRAISAWQQIEAAYIAVYPEAAQHGWAGQAYDDAVAAYLAAHDPGALGGADGPPNPRTDMCSCQTVGLQEACAWFASHGEPSVLCDAEKAHEQVHAAYCNARPHLSPGDPDYYRCVMRDGKPEPEYTPKQRERQEIAAYDAMLKVLDVWYQHHCLSGCKQMAEAGAWAGTMFITFVRTNRTSTTDEKLRGTASYRTALEKPLAQADISGYSVTWEGTTTGRAQFDDVERGLDGSTRYEGHGAGPLLQHPQNVEFNAEILRIDPKRCVYAFETYAAIDSTWNPGQEQRDEALHVQLGDLAIAKGARTLEGARTLVLPISHADWPGPAARLPNDVRPRGQIGGSITIHWRFAPLRR